MIALRTALGLVILAGAIGVTAVLISTKPKAPRTPEVDRAFQVRTIRADPVEAPRVWSGYATARAETASNVSAEIAGVVRDRPDDIDPGVYVEAGTLLVQIDDTEYAATLARAEELVGALESDLQGLDVEAESISDALALAQESVRIAEGQLERLRSAVGAGGASRFEIDELEARLATVRREREALEERLNLIPTRRVRLRAQLESERAAARIARLNVERCRIEAPIAGIIQSVEVDEGERVGIGQAIARVVDLSVIEAPLKLPVSAATRLHLGARAELVGVGPERPAWQGDVSRIAPEADAMTRTVTVYVEVTQNVAQRVGERTRLEGLLLPGQFLSGTVYDGESIERILVPRAAVQRDRVMVVDENDRVEPRIVTIAYNVDALYPSLHPHERQWSVIESGIDPGDRVIISNLDELRSGTPVRPVDATGTLAGTNGESQS